MVTSLLQDELFQTRMACLTTRNTIFFSLFECRELDVRNRSWHRTPFRYVQVGSASIEWPPLFRVSRNGGESFPGLDGDTTRDFQAWRAGALGNRLSPQLMAQGQHAKSGGDAQICGTNNLQYYNVGLVTRPTAGTKFQPSMGQPPSMSPYALSYWEGAMAGIGLIFKSSWGFEEGRHHIRVAMRPPSTRWRTTT